MEPALQIHTERFTALIELERAVRRAETLDDLAVIMVNRTRAIVSYRQAAFLTFRRNRPRVSLISDVPSVDRNAPLVRELEETARRIWKGPDGKKIHQPENRDTSSSDQQHEPSASSGPHAPANLAWVPLGSPGRESSGVLLLILDQPLDSSTRVLLEHLGETFAHALRVFHPNTIVRRVLARFASRPLVVSGGLLILLVLCFCRISVNALAPAEIIPKDPHLVTSPLEGVVQELRVRSNQPVSPGDLLVVLDDTELRNHLEVSKKALEVAKEQYARARRGAFVDGKSKAVMAELDAQVKQRGAEVRYALERLERTRLFADRHGVAITPPPEEWEGRPVSVGETIMQIADPKSIEVRVMLPVDDALVLGADNPVTLFLDSRPLTPIRGRVERAAYMPEATPTGAYAYRITARLSPEVTPPRIGLRGTAKVYGEKVSLMFFLFRRPLTYLRQLVGI